MSERKISLNLEDLIEDGAHENKITHEVKVFYEKIQFPGRRPMEQDSLIFLRKFSNMVDSASRGNEVIRVLDAGCGTGNTSIALAAQFKMVEFVGVDISTTSLENAMNAAKEKNLTNVRFTEWNLLDQLTPEKKFNIILCFGVLHHTAQMQKVLKNLYAVLEDDGTLYLWVYGKYGRYQHSLNVELLSLLLSVSTNDEDPIDLAREFIEKSPDGSVVKALLGNRSNDHLLQQFVTDPTWIADQFLNPNEYMLTMKDLISLVKRSGLKISEWVGAPRDISKYLNSQKLEERFNMLSSEQQIIALDLLLKMNRYFLILQKSQTN
jgi:2-polyprenyl-3-methyl-5-hydroxy-6-metoxy-1,4-benzoquinol methylase